MTHQTAEQPNGRCPFCGLFHTNPLSAWLTIDREGNWGVATGPVAAPATDTYETNMTAAEVLAKTLGHGDWETTQAFRAEGHDVDDEGEHALGCRGCAARSFGEELATDSVAPFLTRLDVSVLAFLTSEALRKSQLSVRGKPVITQLERNALDRLAALADKLNGLQNDMLAGDTSGLFRTPF